jgi:hypothetical protein
MGTNYLVHRVLAFVYWSKSRWRTNECSRRHRIHFKMSLPIMQFAGPILVQTSNCPWRLDVPVVPRMLNQTQESSAGNIFESLNSFDVPPCRQIALLQRKIPHRSLLFFFFFRNSAYPSFIKISSTKFYNIEAVFKEIKVHILIDLSSWYIWGTFGIFVFEVQKKIVYEFRCISCNWITVERIFMEFDILLSLNMVNHFDFI